MLKRIRRKRIYVHIAKVKYTRFEWPFLRLTEDAKWSLFEAFYVGLMRFTKLHFQSMFSVMRSEQLYQRINIAFSEREWKYRLFLFIYMSEISEFNLGIMQDLLSTTYFKYMRKRVYRRSLRGEIDVKLSPVIYDLNDREYIKNFIFDVLQFIYRCHKLPFITFKNFLYPTIELVPKQRRPNIKKSDWKLSPYH